MSANRAYYNRGISIGADPADAVWRRDPDTGNWLLVDKDGKVIRAAAPGGAPIVGPPTKPEEVPQTPVAPHSDDLRAIAKNAAAKKAATDSHPMVLTFSKANRAVRDDAGNRMPVIESLSSLDEAHVRYGHLADDQSAFDYVALFNPKKETTFDPPAWPEPDLEFGGGTIAVPIHVRTKTGVGGWVAAGIATMLGLIVVSGQKKRRS